MMIDTKRLWQRERRRRYALWDLKRLQPVSDRAIQYLAILDDIEREDRDDPVGDAVAMSIDELRECAAETGIVGVSGSHFVVVLDLAGGIRINQPLSDFGSSCLRIFHAQQIDLVHRGSEARAFARLTVRRPKTYNLFLMELES